MIIDIKYQLITTNAINTTALLEDTIKSVIDNLYIESEEGIQDVIKVQLTKHIT